MEMRIGFVFIMQCKKKSFSYKQLKLFKRRRPDLNRWILVLQTIALPLGYCAIMKLWKNLSQIFQ